MTNFLERTGNWDMQTIGCWFVIPVVLVAAFFLPPLLFPLLLAFELLIVQETLSIFSIAAPQPLSTHYSIARKPRSPPAC
jgi:hypothetical protein